MRTRSLLFVACAIALVASTARAAGTACGTPDSANGYYWLTTTVASSTVPACIMPAADRKAFTCRARKGNTTTLMVFGYVGLAVPSSPTTNLIELDAKDIIEDSFGDGGPQTGPLAAVSTGGASDTIDCWWR